MSEMSNYFVTVLVVIFHGFLNTESANIGCDTFCVDQDDNILCGFEVKSKTYQMFRNKCGMESFSKCNKKDFVITPIKYCIKQHFKSTRRNYGDSCPVFCPEYYRPVCGASKYRDYVYRSFNNGCYLDMINCRGDDDFTGYVEVPLQFCQNHLMKNIFKEKIVVSNTYDYRDFD